jgi:hypothetical protein
MLLVMEQVVEVVPQSAIVLLIQDVLMIHLEVAEAQE